MKNENNYEQQQQSRRSGNDGVSFPRQAYQELLVLELAVLVGRSVVVAAPAQGGLALAVAVAVAVAVAAVQSDLAVVAVLAVQ